MVQRQLSSATPLLPLHAAGASDRGRVRVRNEDAFGLCDPPNPTALAQLGRLFILADGVGGQTAGAVASQLAVAAISARYYDLTAPARGVEEAPPEHHPVQHLDGPLPGLDAPLRHIRLAFAAAHARLREDMNTHREHRGMATTCVAAIVKGNQLALAHVGDSRAYLLPAQGHLRRLTVDDGLLGRLVENQMMSEEDARRIDQAMQTASASQQQRAFAEATSEVRRLDEVRAGRARLEMLGEILGFVRHQPVAEFHDAHDVGRRAVIGEGELGDPQVAAADDAPHREALLAGLEVSAFPNVVPPADPFARLRVIEHGVLAIDFVFGVEIAGVRGIPMAL